MSTESSADGWVAVAGAEELPKAKPVHVTAGEKDLMLVRTDERIFAVSNRCTHQGAPLHRGVVKATGSTPTVACAAHGSIFQLTDGRVLRGPAMSPLSVYEARVNGDTVEVRSRP